MLKKILIGAGIVVVLLVAAVLFLDNRNRTLSPSGSTTLENEGLSVTVNYSRPSVRDRLIFGEEEEGALQPYGVYWRLGANEPTEIEVSKDFSFGGERIKAGKYVIYAIPRKGEMELRLNSELRFWGVMEADNEKDVATAIVRMEQNEKTEQFTIRAVAVKRGVNVIFEWDVYQWTLPVSEL
ncbi:MAG: DUF2911 domain-containing protein [Cyclobacteriaceae bacterium]